MKHLDNETSGGSMRMSVNFDESQKEESIVSHKCCHVYGNPATDTIAKLIAKFIPSLAGTDNAAQIGWQLPAEEANFPPLRWEY